ncbi:GTP cyclohydrolase [Mucilaginibacter pallidiroseus]|uniref:GTP cyclohydrolase n=1 Tax=Mucilaginibacter pallidiroseus TaxID=2599295 RepID=A0A563U881_9SPHI|nr:YciI family protein [Mucilaginibacter pallidiroseus]TWR27536.1 GTP cyclohydrolase [Mucilaginibacter pallidiroseus]
MFIINLEYIVPLADLDKHMEAHVAYLKKYYAADVFIMSGRKVPRTGGVIIAQAKSKELMEMIIAEDPFHQHKLAKFTITEFLASQSHPVLKNLIKK